MLNKNHYIIGILLTIIVGSICYAYLCCPDCCSNMLPQKKNDAVILTGQSEGYQNSFSLKSTNFTYSCDSNFIFKKNHYELFEKGTLCQDKGILALKKYFSKTPDARLAITGYCTADENNNSAFPNLGFARANAVKNYFIEKGIASNRFEIDGKIIPEISIQNNLLQGPISYKITTDIVTARGEDWNAIKENLNQNPLILYFNINQTEINLAPEERNKIAELVQYLDNIPDGKIVCIGHTDDSGDRNVNFILGLKRAEFAKNYLIQNGIASEKITTQSKGPDEPIADNLTPEGKAKNRRTVLTLQ